MPGRHWCSVYQGVDRTSTSSARCTSAACASCSPTPKRQRPSMAGVVGELTGAPGACVVTRGPGVASAVNGVAQALLDRQPMVLVADCVERVRARPRVPSAHRPAGADGTGDARVGRVRRRVGRVAECDRRPRPRPAAGSRSRRLRSVGARPAPSPRRPWARPDATSTTCVTLLGGARRPVVVAGVGTRAHGRAVAGDVALALGGARTPDQRSDPHHVQGAGHRQRPRRLQRRRDDRGDDRRRRCSTRPTSSSGLGSIRSS